MSSLNFSNGMVIGAGAAGVVEIGLLGAAVANALPDAVNDIVNAAAMLAMARELLMVQT